MSARLGWTDVREIARLLAARHAGVSPLSLRFTDLHRWITELPGFADDPRRSNEQVLEAIQMAWIDELED
ncbi:MAG: Fe-S cluster assembly protein IscX [Planctomycetes bacterium]|nr:Fe-S cluster assembly protein IscX [Planctomycetota bacterium]